MFSSAKQKHWLKRHQARSTARNTKKRTPLKSLQRPTGEEHAQDAKE
jgi:hypothetical protein